MQTYVLDKGYSYKIFMFIAFSFLCLVMYQGHISKQGIYSILFFASLIFLAFQIASFVYVSFVKRVVEININEKTLTWLVKENNKEIKNISIDLESIEDIKTEINYLTGNIYSNFTITIKQKDSEDIVLSDGLFYDFGLKKAENVCKYLLKHNLGDSQDIKFSKLIKTQNIDTNKEQVFHKKEANSYYTGVISKNKKEFLSLRLQIESLYKEYKNIEINSNNEYKIKSDEIKNSFIHLKSNAIGYFIEFSNVSRKEDLKSLKQMGKRNKIGF